MINLIFDKYLELMNLEDQQGSRVDHYEVITKNMLKFLEKNKKNLVESIEKDALQTMSVKLIGWYNKDGDWLRRTNYIKAMLILAYTGDNEQKSQLEDRIREFSSNAPFESFALIDKAYLSQVVKIFPNNFKDSVLKDLRIYGLGGKYIPKVELTNYVSAMLDKISAISDANEKEQYLDVVVELKGASDKNLIDRLFNELNSLKTSNPELIKKYSQKRIFDSSQRKTLKN